MNWTNLPRGTPVSGVLCRTMWQIVRHLAHVLAFLVAFSVIASTVRAESLTVPKEDSSAAAAPPSHNDEADVVVFNRHITTLRATFLGISAQTRADRTNKRVTAMLEKGGPGQVALKSVPQGSIVMIDRQMAFLITPGDVDVLRGETLEEASRDAQSALQAAISATRESRDRSRLIASLANSAVATLIFAVLIAIVWRVRSWAAFALTKRMHSATAKLRVAGTELLSFASIYMVTRWMLRVLSAFLMLLMTYWWLSHVFGQFPFTRPWSEQFDGWLIDIARGIAGSIVKSLPGLLIAVVIFFVAKASVRFMSALFERIEAGRGAIGPLDADLARPTRRIIVIVIWLFAIAMAYPYLPGSNTDAFRGISILFGLMISLGGSSIFGQAASGMILMYSRALRVGEYVRIADQEGTVTEVGTFTTRLRTGLGEELVLPNSLVIASITKNYSRAVHGPGYIVDTVVTIGYDTPWRQVEAMLVEAAHRTPGVLTDPQPTVFQTSLSDFYPEYRLVCQAIPSEPRPRAEVLANLHANIQDVFNEYNVQIMSPHYLGDPARAKVVPKGDWYATPARPEGKGGSPGTA